MNPVQQLMVETQVRSALAAYRQRLPEALDLIVGIQQIPSPTFGEAERAAYMRSRFEQLPLEAVEQDELNNVYGRLPGHAAGRRPPVVISAHSDTVFPRETDLNIRREKGLLYGPGIADNATGLAGLLLVAGSILEFGLRPAADIWFVANVAEEGLGNLRGMKEVVKRFGAGARYLVVEGGSFGQVSHQAIGVRRFRVEVKAPGGHSWAHFGRPSAIHVLGHIIVAIDRLSPPAKPKTSYNVGMIEGGLSINAIAQSAAFWLDLRSEETAVLDEITGQVMDIVAATAGPDVSVALIPIGERPAGQISRDTPLVAWADAALRAVGMPEAEFMTGSTDANVPLSLGYEAVCVGLARSGNTHRPDEYLDTTHLAQGVGQLLLLALAAAGHGR
jgi:tripeptide aminopeptidase